MILKEIIRNRDNQSVEINIAPLLDMVFILLIFFIVTTSFLQPAGIEVNRPVARTAGPLKSTDLVIAITASGMIYTEGHPVEPAALYSVVAGSVRAGLMPDILITADEQAPTGLLVRVMDECRRAGATNIALAATNSAKE